MRSGRAAAERRCGQAYGPEWIALRPASLRALYASQLVGLLGRSCALLCSGAHAMKGYHVRYDRTKANMICRMRMQSLWINVKHVLVHSVLTPL